MMRRRGRSREARQVHRQAEGLRVEGTLGGAGALRRPVQVALRADTSGSPSRARPIHDHGGQVLTQHQQSRRRKVMQQRTRESHGALGPAVVPQRGSLVRPVSQVIMRLPNDRDASAFANARRTVLKWVADRVGRVLPEDAWQGQSFTLDEVGAQRAEAVAIEAPRYWAGRFDDADKNVAQRVWTTEIAIGENDDGSVLFGTRLQCVTHGENLWFERSIPRFVRTLVSAQTAHLDERVISIDPWLVESEEGVDELVALLTNLHRRSEVFVFSLPEGSVNSGDTAASAYEVAKHTVGTAHVAIITGPASYFLSDRVGKEFSIFGQAVRTYRPGFNPGIDEPFSHPLAMPNKISDWSGDGPVAFQGFLISQALRRSISGHDVERRLPPFAQVRQIVNELHRQTEREAGSSDTDFIDLYEHEIDQLKDSLEKQQKEYDDILSLAEEDREQALQESLQYKAQNSSLRHRIEELERKFQDAGRSIQSEIPDNLDDFESWCRVNITGSVELHNRAIQGAKKSVYKDPSLIFRTLLMLRDHYVPMRRAGGNERREAFNSACQKLGVFEEQSITEQRAGEEGDTYFVKYAGQRSFLDRHLKKGTSRAKEHCFRIYFFWDDDSQQVVVGWLPSHLDTRIT